MLARRLGISKDYEPESRAVIRKAILQKQQERIQKEIDTAMIREQYKRLCQLERSLYKVISGIRTERDLDRPDVTAALEAKGRIENYLDLFLRNSEQDNLLLAQFLAKEGEKSCLLI